MIYASITLGLWLFSHVENTFGLPQSANKNSPVGISSQNKADTSGPGVLYHIRAIKTLPLPDEGSRGTIKTQSRRSTQNAVLPSSKTNTVHVGKKQKHVW